MTRPDHPTTLAALHAGIGFVMLLARDWAVAALEFLLAAEYWRRRG